MRYAILLILTLPIILVALINVVTQYKMKQITKTRLRHQLFLWLITFLVLLGSFPVFNILNGRTLLDSSELSLFDIFQTTAIILLFYIINGQRQHIEQNEKILKKLHGELSIRLSSNDDLLQ